MQKRIDRPRVTVILDSETPEVQTRYRNLGVTNFLTRPIEQSALYNHLMRMLSEDGSLDQFQAHKVLAPEGSQGASRPTGQILIAEDNSVNQLIAQAFLKELGYSFHTVANGKEVLEELAQSEFDLILMDCQMPEMDGFEATREIRKNISTILPIVALTANVMKGDETKCREAGMNDYPSKPFRKDQLKAVLEKHIIAADETPFNSSQLELFKDYRDENGADLRISLIDTYLQSTPESLQKLEACCETDPEQFSQIAHTLKSSTAAVGGVRLSQLLEFLETQETSAKQRLIMAEKVQSEFQLLKEKLITYQQKIT
ncbi:MAG: response regulator [Pseudobdellovibrionaceae bacterium]